MIKALSALAVYIVSVYGDYTFNLVRESDEDFMARLLDGKDAKEGSNLRGSSTEPITDYENTQYYGEVSFGTPEQKFKVLFDTSYSDTIIPSSTCSYSSCYSKARYTSSKSSSYVKKGTSFSSKYGSGSVTGYQSMDTMKFGDFQLPFQNFAEITSTSGLGSAYDTSKYDGVVGLGMWSQSELGVKNPVDTSYSEGLLSSYMFSVYLGNATNGYGQMTIGTYNTSCYTGSITWNSLVDYDYWMITLSDFLVENTDYSKTTSKAMISTSYAYISGPTAEIAAVADKLGAWPLPGKPGMYEIGCDYSLPYIYIRLGSGTTHAVAPGDYLFREGNTNTCVLGFAGKDYASPMWVLGDVFLRRYYAIFDVTSRRIGLASAKH